MTKLIVFLNVIQTCTLLVCESDRDLRREILKLT